MRHQEDWSPTVSFGLLRFLTYRFMKLGEDQTEESYALFVIEMIQVREGEVALSLTGSTSECMQNDMDNGSHYAEATTMA